MLITYYHNPSCSKSRAGLAILEEKGITAHIRLYLQDVPTAEELKDLLQKLNMKPSEILRPKEALDAGIKPNTDEETLLKQLSQNPKALQRPILVIDDKATIGRPTENIINLIENSLS